MDGLLTPVITSCKPAAQREEDLLIEVKKRDKPPFKSFSKASNPEEALEILKNEPDHESLISTLRYLNEHISDFSLISPSPLAAQLVHVLVSDIIPNYWSLFHDGTKPSKQVKGKQLSDLELLLSCIRSITGLNAILLSIKQLIQQSKDTKKTVGGPNIYEVLTILLQVLTEVIQSDDSVQKISNSIWDTVLPTPKQKALWNEFLNIVGSGKILGLAAEAEDVANELSKKVGEKYWIAEGSSYTAWLSRSISHFVRSLPLDSENGYKCSGDLLGKAFRLGHTGKFHSQSLRFKADVSIQRLSSKKSSHL
jgi:telomere length regulation protein